MLVQARAEWGYWVPDMTVQCFQEWHLPLSFGLGIPLLLLLVLGIPFLPVWTIFKRRKMLGTTQMKLHFGRIYHAPSQAQHRSIDYIPSFLTCLLYDHEVYVHVNVFKCRGRGMNTCICCMITHVCTFQTYSCGKFSLACSSCNVSESNLNETSSL